MFVCVAYKYNMCRLITLKSSSCPPPPTPIFLSFSLCVCVSVCVCIYIYIYIYMFVCVAYIYNVMCFLRFRVKEDYFKPRVFVHAANSYLLLQKH